VPGVALLVYKSTLCSAVHVVCTILSTSTMLLW
jgi:hypothetical protein